MREACRWGWGVGLSIPLALGTWLVWRHLLALARLSRSHRCWW